MKSVKSLLLVLCAGILFGCASMPVHDNLMIPPGRIEGNQFVGTRYLFKVTAPSNWKMSTEFPDFLKDLGYDAPGAYDKEQTELYLFNPSTQSSVQIDFTPATGGATFSQKKIEWLVTSAGAESFKGELEEEYGKDIKPEIGPTEPVSLKGVQYAAKKFATYTVKGVRREQGWIYAYAEPNQIFILYMLLEREGTKDRQDFKALLDSFEVVSPK